MMNKLAAVQPQQAPVGSSKAMGALNTAVNIGFPVYQYMSGQSSLGGTLGSAAGGYLGSRLGRAVAGIPGNWLSRTGQALGKSKSLWGQAGGLALRGLGTITNIAGSFYGGFKGFDLGERIGDKIAPIHKRNINTAPQTQPSQMNYRPYTPQMPYHPQVLQMPQIKQASATPAPMAQPGQASVFGGKGVMLSGIGGLLLAAYLGNKQFNEAVKRNEPPVNYRRRRFEKTFGPYDPFPFGS